MDIIAKIKSEILNPLITLLFAAAVGYFLYGVMVFIRNQGSEKDQEVGKQHMVWGVIGIFLMIAVYGILNLIANSVGYARPF